MTATANRPLVSVVIPCFNARPWIEATLASVEAQTWRPLEIVVVDDGSTDGSSEWLQAQASGGRIRLQRQANQGQPAAFNAGLSVARGTYIQFLDADDLLDPDKISAQVRRLAGRVDAVATCAWGRFYGDDPGATSFKPEPCWRDLAPLDWLAAAWHEGGGMLFPALWLVPRDLVDRAGAWNVALGGKNPDGEYFVRILLVSKMVLFCAESRVRYRSGIAGSMSSLVDAESLAKSFESIRLIEQWLGPYGANDALRQGLSLVYQRFARGTYPYAARLAEAAEARAGRLSAARLNVEGGWRYRLLTRFFGWRTTRRLQVWSGRR